MVALSQELRFPLFKWFGGVAFVDAGEIFEFVDDVAMDRLRVGVGLGFRLNTPVIPLSLDYGVPVYREDDYEPRWHFTLGQRF